MTEGFAMERLEKEIITQQRMRALPYHDRIDLVNTYLARNANVISATPYNSRAYAPGLWRSYQRPNIIAGYSTRHMGTSDSGLPYNRHHRSTVTGDTFPSFERFEGAKRTVQSKAEMRATFAPSTAGQKPQTIRSLGLEPDDEANDRLAFTHYLEKHVMCASIVPLPSKQR